MEEQLLLLLEKVRSEGDETARAELNELLRQNPVARKIMAQALVNEQALISHLRDESIVSILDADGDINATLRSDQPTRRPQEITAAAADALPNDHRVGGRTIPLWLTLSAIAASLIVAAFGWFRGSNQTPTESKVGIARVIRIEGEAQISDEHIADGSELFAGDELAMHRGLIELAFRETGVHVVATAPLLLKLNSNQRVSLREGQVKLVVPPQGIGFVVDTAQRKFVDLGTSFVVTAGAKGAEVLVLDGQISVDNHEGTSEDLMREGEFAKFDRNGKVEKRKASRLAQALPELSLPATSPSENSFPGVVLGYDNPLAPVKKHLADDVIGRDFLPMVRSAFNDRSHLESFKQGMPLRFAGIAGAFHEFPDRTGLTPYAREGGWIAWYHGQVVPPRAGRYRFWGYADNHLLVAINGKPVFEGSRRDSSFRELGIPRTDNPALPCLIARAGFACSDWIDLSGDSVELDLLFGDVGGNLTSGLLLVEQEGESYQETFWGQPKWPLFLTETPSAEETAEFERLVNHLEQKTMGSFSIVEDAIWQARN